MAIESLSENSVSLRRVNVRTDYASYVLSPPPAFPRGDGRHGLSPNLPEAATREHRSQKHRSPVSDRARGRPRSHSGRYLAYSRGQHQASSSGEMLLDTRLTLDELRMTVELCAGSEGREQYLSMERPSRGRQRRDFPRWTERSGSVSSRGRTRFVMLSQ